MPEKFSIPLYLLHLWGDIFALQSSCKGSEKPSVFLSTRNWVVVGVPTNGSSSKHSLSLFPRHWNHKALQPHLLYVPLVNSLT